MTTLDDWLARIEQLHPSEIELGLARIGEVIERLGATRPAPAVITVGGTNGKGSCVAFLESLLQASGHSVASYTSPHLWHFSERVRHNGVPADDTHLVQCFEDVEQARGGTPLTYFEFATAVALASMRRRPVDVAVLEVGLGGRLDAVNAVDSDAAIITAVDLDHQDWLGSDRGVIGAEKAAIFRRNCPAICGDPAPPPSVAQTAERIGARLVRYGYEFDTANAAPGWWWRGPRRAVHLDTPGLPGRFQQVNAACALTALDELNITHEAAAGVLRAGVRDARVPGRLTVLPGEITWVFDVAHNPHAARALADWLAATPTDGRTLAVVGMMRDKEIDQVAQTLATTVDRFVCAGLAPPRGLSADALAARLSALDLTAEAAGDVASACERARATAVPGDRIVAFGSFETVGPAMAAIMPPAAGGHAWTRGGPSRPPTRRAGT